MCINFLEILQDFDLAEIEVVRGNSCSKEVTFLERDYFSGCPWVAFSFRNEVCFKECLSYNRRLYRVISYLPLTTEFVFGFQQKGNIQNRMIAAFGVDEVD